MTQILGVITRDYALLASDRRLTIAEGPRRGEPYDDDTCKLVSLCGVCGIAYSGLAHIEANPTHEWIGKTLASENCCHPERASRVLVERAGRAFAKVRPEIRSHTFLISGWAEFTDFVGVRSHFCAISNCLDEAGRALATARDTFDCRIYPLPDAKQFLWCWIGQPLRTERVQGLERNLRKLVARKIGPKEALRLLVDEIIYTSTKEKRREVGCKVLGVCIPKRNRDPHNQMMLAQLPNEQTASFTYFEPQYSELRQYGPTFVCGEYAYTDIECENDASRNYQSIQVRILSIPKSGGRTRKPG